MSCSCVTQAFWRVQAESYGQPAAAACMVTYSLLKALQNDPKAGGVFMCSLWTQAGAS